MEINMNYPQNYPHELSQETLPAYHDQKNISRQYFLALIQF